jgi:hypothetical protein
MTRCKTANMAGSITLVRWAAALLRVQQQPSDYCGHLKHASSFNEYCFAVFMPVCHDQVDVGVCVCPLQLLAGSSRRGSK